MPNFNSTASQILNGTANFLNGVSNAARDVVANPLADMANIKLKTNPYVAAANLATKGKVNKAIDTVTSAAKGEQPNSLQKQPNDPTSIAQATGEGLTRGIDIAASVLTLTDLARQLPKAAQAGWKTILNKVKDAKSKSQQMKLAKEAREYLNKAMDENLRPAINSTAPAYQQRAVAMDNQMRGGNMRTYVDEATDNANKTFKNMTSKMNAANMSKDPAAVKMRTARNEVYPAIDYSKQPNKTYAPLKPDEAAEVFVPYKGSNLKDVQHMQERVNNIAKMSDTEFRKYMDSVERADMAGYGPDWYDYQIADLWHSAGRNSKSLGNLKNQIIDRITYSYDPEQFGKVSGKWQEIVKNNALKNNKVYRKRKVKDIKDKYEKATQPITRAERNAADMNAAEVEKKKIMDQYGISSKDYDEYADAAANTYIYVDKNGEPVNQMAGAGWPGGGEYFIDENREVMPYLKGYAKRHPTVDEYIRMSNEEAELGRLAEEEAEDIAREAGPAYDSDRYLNWSL